MKILDFIYYIYHDDLGTPRHITDTSNNPKWSWDNIKPFGDNSPNENISGSTFKFNLRFPGQYYDDESGLSYNYYRDYNSQIGGYNESDPIGLYGGINTYSYVENNSLSGIDFWGLSEYPIILLDKEKDYFAYNAALNYKSKKNYCTIISHGSEITVNKMDINLLNNFIKYRCEEEVIDLMSCQSANMAQQLSILNKDKVVKGYDKFLWVFPAFQFSFNIKTPLSKIKENKFILNDIANPFSTGRAIYYKNGNEINYE